MQRLFDLLIRRMFLCKVNRKNFTEENKMLKKLPIEKILKQKELKKLASAHSANMIARSKIHLDNVLKQKWPPVLYS